MAKNIPWNEGLKAFPVQEPVEEVGVDYLLISDMLYILSYAALALSIIQYLYGDVDLFKLMFYMSVFIKLLYALVKESKFNKIKLRNF